MLAALAATRNKLFIPLLAADVVGELWQEVQLDGVEPIRASDGEYWILDIVESQRGPRSEWGWESAGSHHTVHQIAEA